MDINNDGYTDLLTGSYNPGIVSLWKGSKDGFLPVELVEQEGYVKGARLAHDIEPWNTKSNSYWNFTSAAFADFDGDGLLDLFVGGSDGFRVSLNKGNKSEPKFGIRNYLLGLDGEPLTVLRPSDEKIAEIRKQGRYPLLSGVFKSYVNPVDWDADGVLDLLITHSYSSQGTNPIEFYRGVKTDKGLRFEDRKPLFTAKDVEKIFPGCSPMVKVVDYNNDGVKDILFGLSLATINGFEIDSKVNNTFIHDLHIELPGKDAGRAIKYMGGIEGAKKVIKKDKWRRKMLLGELDDIKYLTLRHRGYVYVMYGKKNKTKAVAKEIVAKPEVKRKIIKNEVLKAGGGGPLSFKAKSAERVKSGKEFAVEIILDFKDGWHGYANTKGNKEMGLIPTRVTVEVPEGFKKVGDIITPEIHNEGAYEVYSGKGAKFIQKLLIPRLTREMYKSGKYVKNGEYTIKLKLYYQICNHEGCLPPAEETIELKVNVNNL